MFKVWQNVHGCNILYIWKLIQRDIDFVVVLYDFLNVCLCCDGMTMIIKL
jgi:hypothetical protein